MRNIVWHQADPSLSLPLAGICLANAQLYHDLPSTSPNKPLAGMQEHVIQGWAVGPGLLCGAVVEFEVESTVATTIRFRTTCGTAAGLLGAWADPVADSRQQREKINEGGENDTEKHSVEHSRGNWPWSAVAFPCGSLDLKPVPQQTKRITVAVEEKTATPPERAADAFGKQPSDEFGTAGGNKGCWGATLSYDFDLSNSGNQTHQGKAYVRCRKTDSTWYGAVRVEQPTQYAETQLRPISDKTPQQGGFRMTEAANGGVQLPVSVAPGEQKTLRVTLVNGGGATLPVNIAVQNELEIEFQEEPQ